MQHQKSFFLSFQSISDSPAIQSCPSLRYPLECASSPTAHLFAMKKIIASIITVALIIAMTLAAMFTLVSATVYVTAIPSPAQRAVAVGAELVLGVVLLLGTTWLATHLAVRIFHHDEPIDPGAPLV
jgi:hypothetical protein